MINTILNNNIGLDIVIVIVVLLILFLIVFFRFIFPLIRKKRSKKIVNTHNDNEGCCGK